MKRTIVYSAVIAFVGIGAFFSYRYLGAGSEELTELQLENVEALAVNEGPTTVGCKALKDATCHVFDTQRFLVYTGKNQYPGK